MYCAKNSADPYVLYAVAFHSFFCITFNCTVSSAQARIARTTGKVLKGTNLIFLVLGLLAAVPTIDTVANLIALLPRAGTGEGGEGAGPGRYAYTSGSHSLASLFRVLLPGASQFFGIRLLILDDDLAFLNDRVLAASRPE